MSLVLLLALCNAVPALAAEVYVSDSAELRSSLGKAKAGDAILLRPGRYSGEMIYSHLQGTVDQPIYIGAALPELPPIIAGGGTGIQLQSPAHLVMENLVFEGAAVNGINMDDGERPDQPGHHVVLRNITVRGAGSTDLHNGIKLSRINDFHIENYRAEGWGREGQAVNVIGCLRGRITDCDFDGQGKAKVGLQIKGGSSDITVARCSLYGITDRVIQIGGTTGSHFFASVPVTYEASDITVEDCTLSGGEAAAAFVGIDRALFRRNVIYCPRLWIFRILQENHTPGFVPSRRGLIYENVIVWNDKDIATFVDVGQGTDPSSFHFERNTWYCQDARHRSVPRGLPVTEVAGVYGQDPLLMAPADGDLRPMRSYEELRRLANESKRNWRWLTGTLLLVLILLGSTLVVSARRKDSRIASLSRKLQFTPDHAAFLNPAPPLPQLGHIGACFAAWMLLVAVASWWGFDFTNYRDSSSLQQFSAHPWGTDPSRRFDFVAIMLAFVPGGALGALLLSERRPSIVWRMFALVAAPLILAGFALTIELLQGGVTDAVVSRNDLLAAFIGAIVGAFGAVTIGPTILKTLRKFSQNRRHPQPVDWLLQAYLVALIVFSLMPFDVTLHPIHLYHKFQGGLVQLVPFLSGGPSVWLRLLHGLLFVPLGMLVSISGTSSQRPVHKLGASTFICLLCVLVLELVQLFLRSRVVDATQVVTGTLGACAGAWLMSTWGWQNAFLSPLPTNNPLLIRARWIAAGLVMVSSTAILYLVRWWQ